MTANFVFQETPEYQIPEQDCGICMEPITVGAEATPLFVDFCSNRHYFHKYCAARLLELSQTKLCPLCRAQPTKDALSLIAESHPMLGAAPPPSLPRLPRVQSGEERLGVQRAWNRHVQWDFWIKPTAATDLRLNDQDVNAKVRLTFMQYMTRQSTVAFSVPVENWHLRLEVSVSQHRVQSVGAAGPSEGAPVTRVKCIVWLSLVPAMDFLLLFVTEMQRYGVGSMMRRWLGIIGANARAAGEIVTADQYGTWHYLLRSSVFWVHL